MSIIHIGSNYTFRNNILYSQDDKLLFELTEPEINCKIKTYKTTDNLFIAFHYEDENLEYIKSIKTKSQKIIQRDITNMMLAELDYSRMEMFNQMLNVQKNQQIEHCAIFKNQLRLYAKDHDRLNTITDLTGNTFTIYTHNHIIFKTTCVEINEITIINSEKCYEDILIETNVQNKTIKAFLTKENILRTESKVIDCKQAIDSFLTPSLNITIIRNGKNVKISKVDNLVEIKLANLIYNEQQLHYHHHEQIIKGFDFEAEEFMKNNEINDVDNGFYILPDDKISTSNDFIEDLAIAKDFFSSVINSIKDKVRAIITVIISLTVILGILTAIVIVKSIHSKVQAKQNTKQVKNIIQEMNKMENALGQRLQKRGEYDI